MVTNQTIIFAESIPNNEEFTFYGKQILEKGFFFFFLRFPLIDDPLFIYLFIYL